VMKAAISPNYFAAMGIRLRGREFNDADAAGAPGVAIVSESVARRAWPNQDPIGKRVSVQTKPKPEDWLTVVGVAGDIRQTEITQPVVPALYRPYRQVAQTGFLSHMTFVVRTDGNARDAATFMRGALSAVDRDQAPQSMASMENVVGQTIAEPRFQTQLIGGFSVIALLLTAIGIYGVLAAAVIERQREIGIRMALGASHVAVARMIVRRTLLLTAAGVVPGLLAAAALTKVLESLLVEVKPLDPFAFGLGLTAVILSALAAAILPARKASTVDPITALRAL